MRREDHGRVFGADVIRQGCLAAWLDKVERHLQRRPVVTSAGSAILKKMLAFNPGTEQGIALQSRPRVNNE